jgi:hypothetical protein
MPQQRDLPAGMAFGILLEGLLAGYRYLGRYFWRSSYASPRARLQEDRSAHAGR